MASRCCFQRSIDSCEHMKRPGKGAEVGRHDRVSDASQPRGGGEQQEANTSNTASQAPHHLQVVLVTLLSCVDFGLLHTSNDWLQFVNYPSHPHIPFTQNHWNNEQESLQALHILTVAIHLKTPISRQRGNPWHLKFSKYTLFSLYVLSNPCQLRHECVC